jgi:hypothetical protein
LYFTRLALDIDVHGCPCDRHSVYPIPIRNVKELETRQPCGCSVSENQTEDMGVVDVYLDVLLAEASGMDS